MKKIPYIEDMEKWQQNFSFSIPIKIRFSETDMFGHVNNVSAFIYMEEARIEYLKAIGLFNYMSDEHGIPVVADLQCDFYKQLYFGETVHVYVKTNEIGNTSFDLHYMFLNEADDLCLSGRGRLVYINPKTKKPVKLSEDMKQKLRK